MPALAFVHEEDPKQIIFRNAGDLGDIEIMNNQVLIGLYTRPSELKTAGGILITHKTTDEDRFQTKVGVILKMGHAAFEDPAEQWFGGLKFEVGDWVSFRASDGWSVNLFSQDAKTGKKQEQLCRLMDDTAVKMRVSHPDRIY